MVRQRKQASHQDQQASHAQVPDTHGSKTNSPPAVGTMAWATQNKWVVLAIASGACAAFNGVFAKLCVPLRISSPAT